MLDARLLPWQGPQADPRLIASNHLMQLSTLELERAISQELDENPALEMDEFTVCQRCNTPLQFGFCTRCAGNEPFATETPSFDIDSSESSWHADDELDALSFISVPLTLPEQLLAQLRLAIDARDYEIALYLVGNLDEHGYLNITIDEIAQALQVEQQRVAAILEELQHLEPAGIGARNVTECLLLQLERLAEQGVMAPPATRAIIQQYWEELGHHQFEHIRAALKIQREEVEDTFLFIRSNLHPYPAHHHYAQVSDPSSSSTPAIPSVLIHKSATAVCGYEVEVIESQRFFLRINPLYQDMRRNTAMALSPGELEHVTHFLERSRLFLSQLRRRQILLQKVSSYLVEYQRDFLDRGTLALRPLTQKTVAEILGVHVSTISRAIASKFAQLPSQEILPLSRFFSAELRVQELIHQLIANETAPLSDERIARHLKQEYGITLSRQMVANYRTELRLPAARQRALLRGSKNVAGANTMHANN